MARATALRRACGALFALVAFDVLLIVVTGGASLLAPGAPVGPWTLGLRLLLLGLLLAARFRALAEPSLRLSPARLLLALLCLPALFEFHVAGGRLSGDGVMYYVYTRSLVKDFDLDFTNEYAHYDLIARGDLAMPTDTGLRRSIFAVGPGLMGVPFFLAGEAVARGQALLGFDAVLTGYGPCHRNATALGGFVYGFGALLLMHGLLRRHFRRATALGAVLLVWGATFLHWYMVQQPLMSHAPSAFMAALAIRLWDRDRSGRSPTGHALLGLVIGFAMCVRWQNGVLLILPGIELTLGAWRRHRFPLAEGVALLGAAAAGAFPQMAAWKVIYGEWLLRYPPHGADFLRLDHPFPLLTLFSSRHGLLSWTPVLWAGYLGFLPLLRRRPQLAWPLLAPLLLMTYVNMCSGDWWAGGSFSNRRFDSLLPVFACGLAAALDAASAFLRGRPRLALAAAALPFVVWNVALAEQVRQGLVPRDDTVAFPRLVGNAWRVISGPLGSPNTWPASWLFALRHGRPPGQYDLLAGRYLFYRQNNLGGVIELGVAGDDPMLGEGWGRIESDGSTGFRRVRGRARLFAPLDLPAALELRVRAQAVEGDAAREVRVIVNGGLAGRLVAGPEWREGRLMAPASLWRRELNDVELDAGGADVRVDRVVFAPAGGRP